MQLSKYIACICEGGAEYAIIDLLLDSGNLIFTRDDLIDGEPLRCRNGREFEERYLRKGFSEKITVLRILDSHNENFKVSKAYEHKIDVVNIITSPEIEMLIILAENKYKDYKKSGSKPSEYCKIHLKYKQVKKASFVREYFADIDKLKNAIHEYNRITKIKHGEYSLETILAV